MADEGTTFVDKTRVFPCPNCREIISTAMSHCRYCGVAVDPDKAQAAAAIQDKVGQACSDANYAKIMARALPVLYLIGWIPLLGVASWGFMFLLVAIPVMLIRWWRKYNALQTGDPDYEQAKTDTIVALVIWSVMVVVWIIGSVVAYYLLASLTGKGK